MNVMKLAAPPDSDLREKPSRGRRSPETSCSAALLPPYTVVWQEGAAVATMHVAVRRIFRRQLSTDSANALKEMIAEMQAGTPKILPTNVEFAEISSAFDVLREKVNVADELIPVDGILSVVGVQDSAVARQAVTIFSMEKSNGNRVLDLNRFARMVWSYCPAMTEKYFYSFALPFGVEEEARVQDNNELKHIHKDYETVMYVLTAWFVGGKKKSKHEIVPSLGTPEMDNFMSDEFHAFGHDFVMRLNRLFFPAFQFQSKVRRKMKRESNKI